MKRTILVLSLILLAMPSLPISAQVRGGTVNGTVKDEQGGVMPGVTVTAHGVDRTLAFTTGAAGEYRFLDLEPGAYQVTAALTGFTTVVHEGVLVEVGKTVELPLRLKVAALAETVTVSAAAPMVDGKATGTATNFTADEFAKIPTSRDPFSLIRSVPGALVERVNVGGNETGQQLLVVAKAARPQDTSWTLDGVEITDMAAAGQSATYFNFDDFQEVRVSTAGNDVRERTGALTIDLVVKRGGNQYHGTGRGYFADNALQATNVPAELAALATPVTPETADHLTRSLDSGFDVGGPLRKDRAWFYGSYSTQNVQLFRRSTGAIDRTVLHNPNVKVNWQATAKDLVSFLWYNGYKIKDNRAPGVVAIEQPAATFHQGNYYSDFPLHGLWKLADDRVINANLFLSAKYAYFNTGVALTPEGGMDAQAGRNTVTSTAYGSFQRQVSARPQHTATVDLNSFFHTGGSLHNLKYGGGFRTVTAMTENQYPGNGILAITQTLTDLRAQVFREGNGGNRARYFDLYVTDSLSRGRLTVDLGLRYDRQWGKALPSTSLANPVFPDLVPGITFAGYDTPFTWNTVSPRAGVIYALDAAHKTIARVTYSRFAGQLSATNVGFANLASSLGSITYRWTDLNGDGVAQSKEEVNTAVQLSSSNPVSANQLDPALKAPTTQNVVAGVERELRPNLAVQATYSYSRTTQLFGNAAANITPRLGLTLADYTPGPTLTGTLPSPYDTPYSVPTSIGDPAKVAASGGTFRLTNVPGFSTTYHGLELGMVKRLSQKWMGRVALSFNNAREHFDDAAGLYDANGNPTRTVTEPLADGGPFAPLVNAGFGNYYLNATWQLNVNGMYQAPCGLEVAANVFGREGYPFPIYRSQALGADTLNVLLSPRLDTFRYPTVWAADLRLARTFKGSVGSLRLIGDVFNLLNANTALVRINNLGSSSFNRLTSNMTPRILRLGLVVGF